MLIRRIARPMLATTFITRGVEALRSPKPAADAARPTLEGLSKLPDPVGANVPTNAETVAKVTAGVQIGAGLLLAWGRLPRLSSAALAVSVVPGSLGGHAFWNETDPARKAAERRALFADVGLIGGLIIASVDTEGRPSLGWRGKRAARKVTDKVTAVLPSGPDAPNALIDSELVDRVSHRSREIANVALERGGELADVARERGAELADVAAERGTEFADVARERAPKLAKKARKRGYELAELTQDRGADLAKVARERGSELAEQARGRGTELAEIAQDRRAELVTASRKQAKQTRKDLKRAQKELEKRVN
ncbi:DoxX family membrane protein [Mycolicibacterium hodleri]|uniref:DoxX family membrane protein n=1 Tax=Mycolicibacterium hodleri TaxID=49897 RepID=A0A502E7U5_9MYCO|nr:DoxX family membrane protein [Mycolicibacterium hodleri]TPG33527.1 DoxX family membrane protein [Mycolicibacterium hodleri]